MDLVFVGPLPQNPYPRTRWSPRSRLQPRVPRQRQLRTVQSRGCQFKFPQECHNAPVASSQVTESRELPESRQVPESRHVPVSQRHLSESSHATKSSQTVEPAKGQHSRSTHERFVLVTSILDKAWGVVLNGSFRDINSNSYCIIPPVVWQLMGYVWADEDELRMTRQGVKFARRSPPDDPAVTMWPDEHYPATGIKQAPVLNGSVCRPA